MMSSSITTIRSTSQAGAPHRAAGRVMAALPATPDPLSDDQPVGMGHIDPAEWAMAVEQARHVCARLFRDGATPADALVAMGVSPVSGNENDWATTVDKIARLVCASARGIASVRRARNAMAA